MKLRPLFQEDLPSMADIEAVCSKNPWGFGMLKEAVVLRGGFGLGVEEGGRLLGFGLFYRVLDECQVMTLCVHPGHRRRGVGRLLMEGAKKAASRQGAEKMSLEVRKSNAAAQGLYVQLGFFRVGVRKGYYRDGEDAVLMDCLLKEGT